MNSMSCRLNKEMSQQLLNVLRISFRWPQMKTLGYSGRYMRISKDFETNIQDLAEVFQRLRHSKL
jgi:hypothetical protein